MFYKKVENDRYVYVAINKMGPIREWENRALYGQRHYHLELADGTSVEHTFEADHWSQFSASFKKGGAVINE